MEYRDLENWGRLREDCYFCRIIMKTKADSEFNDSYLIYADDNVCFVLDECPPSMGSTLLIPKLHLYDLAQFNEDVADRMGEITNHVSSSLQEVLGAIKINVLWPDRHESEHFHLELVPIYNLTKLFYKRAQERKLPALAR